MDFNRLLGENKLSQERLNYLKPFLQMFKVFTLKQYMFEIIPSSSFYNLKAKTIGNYSSKNFPVVIEENQIMLDVIHSCLICAYLIHDKLVEGDFSLVNKEDMVEFLLSIESYVEKDNMIIEINWRNGGRTVNYEKSIILNDLMIALMKRKSYLEKIDINYVFDQWRKQS